ncbi:Folate-binding protein YgfZ [Alcanivorax sp. 97CO-5]|jgi:folate-binding protein YgfZ|uniref:CAF17-like 4Fe-4S cluster assembly/insertion protein YgfZ n=1 Tax=Alcanivorax TaxID=59753 RepID=UPI0003E7FF69|nr:MULTISPECIES: folate-binding protein YgfZ [unclassified Alcanivorax]EUC69574.1 Folate-binding protein YgfZ [Alcanivorax sp. 97CO-5]PKG01480.1 folate-binding protein [Alcanivorax sp. 97CO-6]BAP14550.1 folate-binding protein YgfZ [Alcanivorax sp. NBRC 101098]
MSWSEFIAAQPLADHAPTDNAPTLSHCDHLAIIRAHGEEAGHYLQGQLSCDLREVDNGGHLTGMHLSLKGRGLVSVRIVRDGNDYLMLCPAGQSEAVIKSLMKYRLRAKVEFQVDNQAVILGLSGALPGALPEPGQSTRNDQGLWLRYPNTDHALLITHTEQAEAVWAAQAQERTALNGNGWRLADIDAGEGMVYPGAEDLFLPQVLNYDVTAGVNFKKGCYTGQEVVARMHFKGKLKQRMQRVDYTADMDLTPGETLRDSNGKAAGEVVSSARTPAGHSALVVLRRNTDGVLFKDAEPLNSQLGTLPYTLPWKD